MRAGEAQAALDALYATLERVAHNKRCLNCKSRVWVAWARDTWRLRCVEGWDPKTENQPHYAEERMAKMTQQYDPRVGDLAVPEYPAQDAPLVVAPRVPTIEEFDQRQALIKHVVAQMKDGVHYGIIPSTSDRSLWEPGAEYLRMAFGIQWDYTVTLEREDMETGDFFYRVRAFHVLPSGHRVGGWEASAWSKERKFWCSRNCAKPCPQDHPALGMEFGMLPHNVRDRAIKRAFVALIRNVTGTTGDFKEGLEVDDAPAQGPAPRGGNGDKHPWLVECPIHGVSWFKTEKMREPAHRVDNDWCNQSKVLNAALKDIMADSWSREEVNAWIKAEYQGKPWSKLTPEQQVDVIDGLKSMPPPSSDGGGPLDIGDAPEVPGAGADGGMEDVPRGP